MLTSSINSQFINTFQKKIIVVTLKFGNKIHMSRVTSKNIYKDLNSSK